MNATIKKRIEDINNGQVPEGYEETSFGIFPCDWEKDKAFGDICNIYSGGTPNTKIGEYWDGDIPWCVPTDITKSKKYIYSTERNITGQGLKNSSSNLMPVNSILMCSRATIGPRCINKVPMATNQGFKNLICKKGYDHEFIYYYIDIILKTLLKKSNGSTFLELSKSELEKSKCILPKSEQEQSRIAKILMTWDKAIELQEKYIDSLENRKKALMQRLLNDKKDIEYIKLSDLVAKLTSGGTPLTSQKQYYNGDIVWVSIDDMSNSDKYIANSERKITQMGLENSSAKIFPKGAILYAMYASIGKCVIAKVECATSQAILGIVCNDEKLYNEYLYYYLCSIQGKIVLMGQKGTQANLNKEMVENFTIPIKIKDKEIDIKWQKYIADILSKADKEMSLHRQKLDKLIEQRKVMQQYLLTGIVRV